MNRGERELVREVDALRGDLAAVRGDLAALAGTLGEVAPEKVTALANRIGEAAQQASDEVVRTAREARHRAEARGRAGLEAIEKAIEERPFASIAVAFAAGLILAGILGRSRR
ncbi:MAG TPA: hypothetical protein VNT30_09755 [Stellaceae bacterium]|nr:hypothetical protein [Stellaceae bacterium]